MKKYTTSEIKELGVCYSREELGELFKKAGVEEVSALDILKTILIPAGDKIYICAKILPDKLLHLFACDCAERALQGERKKGREPDIRSWDVIRIKRLWIDGEASDDELETARSVAWAAAGSVARAAAMSAAESVWAAAESAWSAARYATRTAARSAWSAAESAARAAARAAAESATESAAESAEREWQVKRLIKLTEEEAK